MTGNGSPRGAWVSYGQTTVDPSIKLHSSEIQALRAAVGNGGRAVFVEFGQGLSDAINGADNTTGGEQKPKGRKRADPLPPTEEKTAIKKVGE